MRAMTRGSMVLAAIGVAVLAGGLRAQESGDRAEEVRVFAFGQGSYLGAYIADVTAEDVERLGLDEEAGVRITGLAEDGPAREAGLREDDVIVRWNEQRLESEAQLRRHLRETPSGRAARLGIVRGGSETSLTVELARRGSGMFSWRSALDDERAAELRGRLEEQHRQLGDLRVRVGELPHVAVFMSRGGRLGVGIQSLRGQLAEYFGLGDREGVLVTSVREDSPAENAGLRAGDVIISVDGEALESPSDVARKIRGAEAGPVSLGILRDGEERSVTVDLPEAESHWSPGDGEKNGFFFRMPDTGFEEGDVQVEWVEPQLQRSRLRLLRESPASLYRLRPVREGSSRRSLSI